MPIYEYKCEHCGETFEILQKFNDHPLTECILCQHGPVKKLISASAFVLKGSGFYVNDYPSENRKKAMDAEKNGTRTSSSDKKSIESSKSSSKQEQTKTT
jgi:putative FmdB family regulatory protein